MTTNSIKATPLHQLHVDLGAKMVDFGGWDMPMQYKTGIFNEHIAVRSGVGRFDVSHMGRLYIHGKNAPDMLQYLLTNDASQLKPGHAHYSFLIDYGEDARPEARPRTLDDCFLYMHAEDEYTLVVNASTAEQDFKYLSLRAAEFGVDLVDRTEQTALIAVQGPASRQALEQLVGPISIKIQNRFAQFTFNGSPITIATTGYTGAHGKFEVFTRAEMATQFWAALGEVGAVAIGLGARNTLREEAGLLLNGHDLTPHVSPREAGMGFAVKPGKKARMIGQDFYAAQMNGQGMERYFTILEVAPVGEGENKRPRSVDSRVDSATQAHVPSIILRDNVPVGQITSGTIAPMLHYENSRLVYEGDSPKATNRSIALGWVWTQFEPGTEVQVRVHGVAEPFMARVMKSLLLKDPKDAVLIDGKPHVMPVTHFYGA